MSAAGFKVHFTPTEQGMALEDFNGKEIWDAAWGETDYDYSDEQEEDEDDEESAPWGLTNKRIEGFPELPGEQELKEREEVSSVSGNKPAAKRAICNASHSA